MQGLEIGRMEDHEVEEATAMMVDALHEHYITDVEMEMRIALDESTVSDNAYNIVRSQIYELLKDPNAAVFAARLNGVMVGYAIVVIENNVADFWDIVVKKEHRNLGIGKMLIAEVEGFAKERSCLMIKLDVNAQNNRAMELYRSLGYRVISYIMIKGDMKNGL